MPKQIPLTQGKYAIVDDEDYAELTKHKWHTRKTRGNFYAARMTGVIHRNVIYMHRAVIKSVESIEVVDHINGNGLDNRKNNLRVSSFSENQRNRGMQKNNTSGYKGVSYYKKTGKWVSVIGHNGTSIRVGTFDTPEEAAKAYDEKAKELHGEFAQTNF